MIDNESMCATHTLKKNQKSQHHNSKKQNIIYIKPSDYYKCLGVPRKLSTKQIKLEKWQMRLLEVESAERERCRLTLGVTSCRLALNCLLEEQNYELMIILPPALECWNYKLVPQVEFLYCAGD